MVPTSVLRTALTDRQRLGICVVGMLFLVLPLHGRIEEDAETLEETIYKVRACPDKYNFLGKVTWMDFIKVSLNH